MSTKKSIKDIKPNLVSEKTSKDQEFFYIGWMPGAPKESASFVRKTLFIITPLIILASILLSLQQKKFSTAAFEYGRLTEMTGLYQNFPVPSLKLLTGKDTWGNTTYITVPLVGYGKFGAETVIASLEKQKNITLDKKELTLRGTLLYSDGKALLQIDENDEPLLLVKDATGKYDPPLIKELGSMQLAGEILDPKCYFGVMKPGHGKPHRDCAIRCIEGGISPVLHIKDKNGASDYYLVLDENGNKMNHDLKDHVAEPISLSGKVINYDDWTIIYCRKESIKRIARLSWIKTYDETIACGPSKKK